MSRVKFKIKMQNHYTGEIYTKETSGTKLEIPGFEEFKFAIRREDYYAYSVGEVTTGMRVSDGIDKEEAIEQAVKKLNSKGADWFRETLSKLEKINK